MLLEEELVLLEDDEETTDELDEELILLEVDDVIGDVMVTDTWRAASVTVCDAESVMTAQ